MKKARPDEKQCPICGKWFYPNRRLRKWCSAECGEKGIKIQSEKHVYRKICPCCGKEFETNKQFQKYCCRACQKKATPTHIYQTNTSFRGRRDLTGR